MISVEQARDIISSSLKVLQPVNMPLAAAFNHVLAADVFSSTDISPFPQSAMDGWASYFLKGKIINDTVMPLTAQEFYKLSSFAVADCLIVLGEDKTTFSKGDIVEIHLLPQ